MEHLRRIGLAPVRRCVLSEKRKGSRQHELDRTVLGPGGPAGTAAKLPAAAGTFEPPAEVPGGGEGKRLRPRGGAGGPGPGGGGGRLVRRRHPGGGGGTAPGRGDAAHPPLWVHTPYRRPPSGCGEADPGGLLRGVRRRSGGRGPSGRGAGGLSPDGGQRHGPPGAASRRAGQPPAGGRDSGKPRPALHRHLHPLCCGG